MLSLVRISIGKTVEERHMREGWRCPTNGSKDAVEGSKHPSVDQPQPVVHVP
jgi:hypothetical protein